MQQRAYARAVRAIVLPAPDATVTSMPTEDAVTR
jgi:hypothetical protein